MNHKCPICSEEFNTLDVFDKHIENHKDESILNEIPKHNHGAAGNHIHKIRTGSHTGDTPGGRVTQWAQRIDNGYKGNGIIEASGNHTYATEGSSWGHNNQPPYYVLTYIMKLLRL